MSLLAVRAALRARPPGPVLSRAHSAARPSSWAQKIWRRPDGTRRSKLKGAIYVTVVSTALLLYEGGLLFQRSQPSYVFVAKLQQIDSRLPIDESSTLSDVVAYILALGDIINLLTPDMEPNYMAKLAKVHKEVSKAVPQHNENVRKIFHDIHKIFASADQPFTEDTATEILEIFDKFRAEVVKMVGMKSDEERPVNEEAGLDEKDQLQMSAD